MALNDRNYMFYKCIICNVFLKYLFILFYGVLGFRSKRLGLHALRWGCRGLKLGFRSKRLGLHALRWGCRGLKLGFRSKRLGLHEVLLGCRGMKWGIHDLKSGD